MSVVHLSSSDASGGAGRAAYRLHRGLRETGRNSRMFVRSKSSNDAAVVCWDPDRTFFRRLSDRARRLWRDWRFRQKRANRSGGTGPFSQAWTIDGRRIAHSVPKADVYNLHWINRLIDPLPFFEATDAPVVWTLHDMNPFTGGCHYNDGCRRFERQCGACPQLGSSDSADLSRTVWDRKRNSYQAAVEENRLHIVTPSEWLSQEAAASTLFSDAPITVIPYGLDTTTFRPRDTEGLRRALEIPRKHRIVLFVAAHGTPRKGFDLLVDALATLKAEDVTLLSIGGDPEMNVSLPYRHLGRITSDVLLSVFYSLADLFVIPSRQDNLPNTVLEAMASGTPVVGFDTGGIPDMVRPGKTGWLAQTVKPRSLREKIEQALEDDQVREEKGKNCRRVVENEYTMEAQASRYCNIYDEMKTDV